MKDRSDVPPGGENGGARGISRFFSKLPSTSTFKKKNNLLAMQQTLGPRSPFQYSWIQSSQEIQALPNARTLSEKGALNLQFGLIAYVVYCRSMAA